MMKLGEEKILSISLGAQVILHNCYDYDSVVSLVRIFTAIAIDMIKTVSSFDAKNFHVLMNYVSLIHDRIVLSTKSLFC